MIKRNCVKGAEHVLVEFSEKTLQAVWFSNTARVLEK